MYPPPTVNGGASANGDEVSQGHAGPMDGPLILAISFAGTACSPEPAPKPTEAADPTARAVPERTQAPLPTATLAPTATPVPTATSVPTPTPVPATPTPVPPVSVNSDCVGCPVVMPYTLPSSQQKVMQAYWKKPSGWSNKFLLVTCSKGYQVPGRGLVMGAPNVRRGGEISLRTSR